MPTKTKPSTEEKLSKLRRAMTGAATNQREEDELALQLNSILLKSALVRFLERLPAKERKEYVELIDRGASVEECAAFLTRHKRVMDRSVAEAVDELADDILSGTP